MNWKVFKLDNPSTHPDIDCPMVVYKPYTSCFTLDIHYFDNERKKFYQKEGGDGRWYKAYDECFYSYIGYLPYIEKEFHPIKCDMQYKTCEHEDDGYCLCDNKCRGKCQTTEYSLGLNRIWKDF